MLHLVTILLIAVLAVVGFLTLAQKAIDKWLPGRSSWFYLALSIPFFLVNFIGREIAGSALTRDGDLIFMLVLGIGYVIMFRAFGAQREG